MIRGPWYLVMEWADEFSMISIVKPNKFARRAEAVKEAAARNSLGTSVQYVALSERYCRLVGLLPETEAGGEAGG